MKPANTTPLIKEKSIVDAVKTFGDSWPIFMPEYSADECYTHDHKEFFIMAYAMRQPKAFRAMWLA